MRIVSLLPSATEIVCALGLEDQLVAVTHECDYPPGVLDKPRVTRSAVDTRATSREIHNHISATLHRGSSIYHLDQELLEQLKPDLILTQELCDVCAVSYKEVRRAVRIAQSDATIVSLEPATLEEVLESILQVGDITGRREETGLVVVGLQERMQRVASAVAGASERPRVLCMEWLDPVMVGGHWVPGMVELVGGIDVMGKPGEPSFQVSWQQVLDSRPEVVVLMPCGFHLQECLAQWEQTTLPVEWHELPAVQRGQVFAVNGSSFFNRPGPRLVDGLEILAAILQPTLFHHLQDDAFQRMEVLPATKGWRLG